jgi:ATP-dependent DNA helicase RecG
MSESQNIKYKSSWHDDYLKWICDFANAQGKYFSFNFVALQK